MSRCESSRDLLVRSNAKERLAIEETTSLMLIEVVSVEGPAHIVSAFGWPIYIIAS